MNSQNTSANREEGLRGRIFSGMIWTNLGQITQILCQLIAIVVLARLLSPHDFGVFAVGLIMLGIAEGAFWLCLEQAVVQHKGELGDHVDIAWTGNLLGAIAGYLILAPLTPLVTNYVFNVPEATYVTWLLLLCPICTALKSPTLIHFHRQIDLQSFFYLTSIFAVMRYLGAILIALWLDNYWALAIGYVAGRVAEVILSYILLDGRPKLAFSKETFWQLYRYSSWLQAIATFKNITRHLDSMIVGSIMSTSLLGIYNRAWTIAAVPLTGLESIVYRVFFPMFSAVQEQPQKSEQLAKHANDFCLLLWVPIYVLFAVAGTEIINFVLGSKWLQAAPVIPLLTIGLALRSLTLVLSSLLRANGLSREAFLLNIIPVVVVAAAIFPLVGKYGLSGAAIAVALGAIVCLICTQWVIQNRLSISLRSWLPALLICAAAALIAVYGTTWLMGQPTLAGGLPLARIFLALTLLLAALFAMQLIFRSGPLDTLHVGLGRLKEIRDAKLTAK